MWRVFRDPLVPSKFPAEKLDFWPAPTWLALFHGFLLKHVFFLPAPTWLVNSHFSYVPDVFFESWSPSLVCNVNPGLITPWLINRGSSPFSGERTSPSFGRVYSSWVNIMSIEAVQDEPHQGSQSVERYSYLPSQRCHWSQPEIVAGIRLSNSLHGSGFTIFVPGCDCDSTEGRLVLL